MQPALPFLGGLITMGFVIAGVFFFRFWRRTKDGLFRLFAFAFWLFALNQAVISLGIFPREQQAAVYLLRLAGYGLIIAGIVAKNMRSRAVSAQPSTPQQKRE